MIIPTSIWIRIIIISKLRIRFLMNNIVVNYKSSNRKTTMDSNVESEYIATS